MFFPNHRKGKIDRRLNFKILPCSLLHNSKEFQPTAPCVNCFPESHQQAESLEELGVRNLLSGSSKIKQVDLHRRLKNTFSSIQVHQAQLERQNNLSCFKVYVSATQTYHDREIVQFCLGFVQGIFGSMQLNTGNVDNEIMFVEKNPRGATTFFLEKQTDSVFLKSLAEKLEKNGLALRIRVIFVSVAYEFHASNEVDRVNAQACPKPAVRVNFSQPYILSEFSSHAHNDVPFHVYYEIWKNTPVMTSHIVGFLSRYKNYSKEDSFEKWMSGIKSVRNMLCKHFDIMGVGDFTEITRQSLNLLEFREVSSYLPSVILGFVKYQAIMVKSLFACVDINICHSENLKLNKSLLLEKFRSLTRILQNDLRYLQPPCKDTASIESNTLDYFMLNGVISESSDEVLTVESRVAKNIALNLDIDSDEEDDLAYLPPVDIFIYVNIENLKAARWMVSIVDEMLEIYLCVAKMAYEIRYLDAMEISDFLEKVKNYYSTLSDKQWNELFSLIVDSALKLLESEGIIARYFHSSDIGVVFCLLPFQEERLFLLIHEISEFFS